VPEIVDAFQGVVEGLFLTTRLPHDPPRCQLVPSSPPRNACPRRSHDARYYPAAGRQGVAPGEQLLAGPVDEFGRSPR
jgi:hypothetical protein